jgi:hypothetical protein
MKSSLAALITLLALMPGSANLLWAQSSETQPFTLTLSTDHSQVHVGDQVLIKIVMTNISDKQIDCTGMPSNGLDRNYQYEVHDEDGQVVPKIRPKYPDIGETSSVWPCILKPGESHESAGGLISRLYDLSRPGRYMIQAQRLINGDAHRAVVKSNMITITVLPKSEPAPQ